MLQEILPKVLKPDLNSVFGSPEHLELFLLAQQKVPKKLEKLMGPINLFSDENIPRCEGGGQVGCLIPGAASPSIGLHHDPWSGGGVHVAPGAWPLSAGECPLSLLHCTPHLCRLVTVLKTVANSVKKERKLPTVALDLLRLALQEDKFPWFWKEVVEQGLLKKQFWPARCMGA